MKSRTPDGRAATNLGGHPPFDPDDGGPMLRSLSGGGATRGDKSRYVLAPLPLGGDLTIIAAWPECGIRDARATIHGALIEAALARVVTLWPEDTDGDDRPRPSPRPPMPLPDSWFARAFDTETTPPP